MTITVVGGTFTIIHAGHKILLREACRNSDKVIVGLATDEFSESRKEYRTVPYETREKNLLAFFREEGCTAEIRPLTRSEGTASEDPSFERLVVSEETYSSALSINAKRKKNGLEPLLIEKVSVVLSRDFFPISSRRILGGEIDPEGSRKIPLRVVISSGNELKRSAVESFFKSEGVDLQLFENREYDTEEQPFGDDITAMALKRARSAGRDYDYSLGIEAGLMYDRAAGCYFDVHTCVVIDRHGNVTSGTSSGFQVPEYLIDRVKQGVDISRAYEWEHGTSDIGKHGGIVDVFSRGNLSRIDLINEAIRNAFIPRRSPYIYGLHYCP